MGEQEKRKFDDKEPKAEDLKDCAERNVKIKRSKNISQQEYLTLVQNRVAFPLRLHVKGATEGTSL